MKHIAIPAFTIWLASSAGAQTVLFNQPLFAGGGNVRASQLWVDPSGQNDSDNDAIAWEDFTLQAPATVTRIQWWGQAAPPLGFTVSFFNQDPNTTASQPDIFRPEGGPIAEETHATVTSVPSGGFFLYTLDLDTPIAFDADTRYFVSVVGLTPFFSASWGWPQGAGAGTTFWWQRGAHMYFQLPENRALVLLGDPVSSSCNPADVAEPFGSLDFSDVVAFLSAFGAMDPLADLAEPFGSFDFSDVVAFLSAFGAGCP